MIPDYNHPRFKTFLNTIQGLAPQGQIFRQVSFYVVSDKTFAIKKIDLNKLITEGKFDQLQTWHQEKRLAAVVKKGNEIYAHVHKDAPVAKDLVIDGETARVKLLSEEEYLEMAEVSELVMDLLKEELADKESTGLVSHISRNDVLVKEYTRAMALFINAMEQIPEKIKQRLLQKWAENIREIEEQSRAEDKANLKKLHDIDIKEENRQIRRSEISKEEATRVNVNLSIRKKGTK